MQYLGGKEKISFPLVRYLQPFVDKATAYVEPFVGGASIICRITHPVRIGSDLNEALINMYRALVNGWEPPAIVTEEEYERLKILRDPKDPMTAFAGFGCSFSGKWFGGYARDVKGITDSTYAQKARNSLLRKLTGFKNVNWKFANYESLSVPKGAVVYCDPPYTETTEYKGIEKFNPKFFWDWVRLISKDTTVFVSEYSAPDDMHLVCSLERRLQMQTNDIKNIPRVECLFTPNDITDIQLRKIKPVGFISRRASI